MTNLLHRQRDHSLGISTLHTQKNTKKNKKLRSHLKGDEERDGGGERGGGFELSIPSQQEKGRNQIESIERR